MSGLRIPGELGITAHSSRGVFKRSLRERSGIEIDFLLGWSQHIPGIFGLCWGQYLYPPCPEGQWDWLGWNQHIPRILVCAGGSIYIPLARRGNGIRRKANGCRCRQRIRCPLGAGPPLPPWGEGEGGATTTTTIKFVWSLGIVIVAFMSATTLPGGKSPDCDFPNINLGIISQSTRA